MAFPAVFILLLCAGGFTAVLGSASEKDSDTDQRLLQLETVVAEQKRQLLQQDHLIHSLLEREGRNVAERSDDAATTWEPIVQQLTLKLDIVSAQLQALENRVISLPTQSSQTFVGTGSSTYVRWGSSSCPNATSTLVYSGVVGGSPHNSPGGAANHLCLPLNPEHSTKTAPSTHADLYGSEYQTENAATANNDPVCAVCTSPGPAVMIPARSTCPTGWHQLYTGFLMSGRSVHSGPSEFLCVDSAFEMRAGSVRNQEGSLLYYTLAHCGSLPCPPYVDRTVVTCVVCTA